ncbi:MAG: helix-turn-helix transcriptional regulator [Alphaproteobacteria bacterium]|jgi:DNA-binding transcriptional ArsR family regulator|nr:helix-turn-helix transcriptional regulator [Alphaproteobacteria bacterium]
MLNQSPSLDRVFHALADPTRLALVERLGRGAAPVSALAEPLAMSLPAVLQHLNVLEGAGLVRSEKRGRVRTCALQTEALDRLDAWLAAQRSEWEQRLDRLTAYLDALGDADA